MFTAQSFMITSYAMTLGLGAKDRFILESFQHLLTL